MSVYISLLRGINVAGQKLIKMADLRALYQALNFNEVQSYIQSGNVIFKTKSADTSTCERLAEKINHAIAEHYKFNVPVFVLTPDTLMRTRKNMPFTDIDFIAEGSKVLLCFLSQAPTNSVALLTPYLKNNEQLHLVDHVLYLYCPDGLGSSKLTLANIEKKLHVNATARNLKTVDKLIELSH